MTPIRIPRESERGLASIVNLDDESIERIIAALADAPPTFHPERLAEKIAAKIDGVSREDIDGIVSTAVSIYSALDYFDSSLEELAENIGRAMSRVKIEGLELSEGGLARLKERLIRFLSLDSIGIQSRAINLLREQDHAFCGARVLTDIRPLFANDLKASPTAGLIVHTLRISYHQGADLKQFYVAMDSEDIEALKKVLSRADSKAENLQSVLEAAKITCLDV